MATTQAAVSCALPTVSRARDPSVTQQSDEAVKITCQPGVAGHVAQEPLLKIFVHPRRNQTVGLSGAEDGQSVVTRKAPPVQGHHAVGADRRRWWFGVGHGHHVIDKSGAPDEHQRRQRADH